MLNKFSWLSNILRKLAIVILSLSVEFLPNKYLYTSLMQTYVVNNDPHMALKILD
jgi:hypothetical protein